MSAPEIEINYTIDRRRYNLKHIIDQLHYTANV